MSDASVGIPVTPEDVGQKQVDCETLVRDGITYYRQRVVIESLPDMANETASDTVGVLGKILKELKLLNLHLASMTGEKFTKADIGE